MSFQLLLNVSDVDHNCSINSCTLRWRTCIANQTNLIKQVLTLLTLCRYDWYIRRKFHPNVVCVLKQSCSLRRCRPTNSSKFRHTVLLCSSKTSKPPHPHRLSLSRGPSSLRAMLGVLPMGRVQPLELAVVLIYSIAQSVRSQPALPASWLSTRSVTPCSVRSRARCVRTDVPEKRTCSSTFVFTRAKSLLSAASASTGQATSQTSKRTSLHYIKLTNSLRSRFAMKINNNCVYLCCSIYLFRRTLTKSVLFENIVGSTTIVNATWTVILTLENWST